jgi:hypothetical protein
MRLSAGLSRRIVVHPSSQNFVYNVISYGRFAVQE